MLYIFVKRMYSYAWCSVHGVKEARFPGMSEVSGSISVSGLCFLLIFIVFTLCLRCYSPLLSSCTVKRGAPSTVLRKHAFQACQRSRVRYPCQDSFSIDLCYVYLVFTMLYIFVKRMYSYAWCSVHGVKEARFPGMSEVSGSISVSGLFFY